MTPFEYKIVPYSPNDRTDLLRFLVKLWDGNRGQADHLLMSATSRNASVMLAKAGDQVVGYAEVIEISPRKVHFNRTAVLKDYRRQGLFGSMLQAVVRKAGRKEITAEVSTDAHHLPAMRRVGFEVAEIDGSRAKIKRPKISLFG